MAEQKNFWKSRTLWTTVLTIIAGVATMASNELTTGGVITGLGLLYMLLRVVTKTKLE